jgi:acyl-CoA synthetase (AMP-forming)/AMP-acid ligase II
VPPELAAAVEKKLPGGKTIQLWGMTELQAGSFSRPSDPADVRHGTAGAATPGTELRVVDHRLQVRGPSLFKEYFNNPVATRQAFTRDGWFETGDTAELSAGGHLRFTGRVKEIINRGGVKYSPVDIEALIERMPGVARCAIVPYPDAVLGERACVFVQPAPGASRATLEAITRELDRAGVAKFKWPERLELVDAMPLTPTQKVMRGRLRERLKT